LLQGRTANNVDVFRIMVVVKEPTAHRGIFITESLGGWQRGN
jgi:hypothetical protein